MSSEPFSTATAREKKEVMVKMFTGSVILSECLVGLDQEVVCEVRLKRRNERMNERTNERNLRRKIVEHVAY